MLFLVEAGGSKKLCFNMTDRDWSEGWRKTDEYRRKLCFRGNLCLVQRDCEGTSLGYLIQIPRKILPNSVNWFAVQYKPNL